MGGRPLHPACAARRASKHSHSLKARWLVEQLLEDQFGPAYVECKKGPPLAVAKPNQSPRLRFCDPGFAGSCRDSRNSIKAMILGLTSSSWFVSKSVC